MIGFQIKQLKDQIKIYNMMLKKMDVKENPESIRQN